MLRNRYLRFLLPCVAASLVVGCNYSTNEDITVAEGNTFSGNAATINGNVKVEKDADASESSFKTVNGNVVVEDGARVRDCATVNGSVKIGDRTKAGDLRTVNGDMRVGRDARVDGHIQLVNGSVDLAPGSEVLGDVGTVNGLIEMRSARVEGDIKNTNGGMMILEGSEVFGDLTVKEAGDDPHTKPPKIVVGEGVRIRGKLVFERPVELYVHDTAEIGPVTGAKVNRYSGSETG
ncbi:MAG: hypothetical protein PVI25_09435 [Gammaproteobacteria bacterium]|jgi:DUF4097 and DUF4098 domain-containing protein YvlB